MRREVQQVLLAARYYELTKRQKGERNGRLGSVALEVLALFVDLVDVRTGRLELSIGTIMARTGRSRDAILRALKNLRAQGFLDWSRGSEPTGPTGRGTPSNAYRLLLPEKAQLPKGVSWNNWNL